MPKIIYQLSVQGKASDIRYVPDAYVLQAGERLYGGQSLPEPAALHTPEYRDRLRQEQIRLQRREQKRQALIDQYKGKRLDELSPEDITAYMKQVMAEDLDLD